MLHGLGWGIWGVIFNLYLLSLGFKEDFIGYMFFWNGLVYGLAAFPAGIICDRIGRRVSFLTGATASVLVNFVQALTADPFILLSSSFLGGLIGPLSWVAEAPFLMENSEPEERTHLFSVSSAIFLISSMMGSLLGGIVPQVFGSLLGAGKDSVLVFKTTLVFSITFSLIAVIPYCMIKERQRHVSTNTQTGGLSLKNIRSKSNIFMLSLTAGLIGLGAGFIVPFFNVFFARKLKATPEEIGVIFACGEVTTAVGSLLAPIAAKRLGKVKAVAFTELSSIPFIYAIAVSPNLGFAAFSYLSRVALMNMAGPIRNNFTMEAVMESERGTTSGLTIMADGIPRAVSSGLAGQIMSQGNYFLPYVFTTILYFFASTMFLLFFRKREKKPAMVRL